MTSDRAALEALLHRAAGLLDRLGLDAPDRLATALGRAPSTFAVAWACMLAGVREVALHGTASASDADEILSQVDATALLVDDHTGPGVLDAARRAGLRVIRLDLHDEQPLEPPSSAPTTRAIGFTSGTTGRRKGVDVGIHDAAWGRSWLSDEAAAFDGRHGDHALVLSPLHHSGPLRHALVVADAGGSVTVLPDTSVDTLLAALRRTRPTSLFCVPTQLHRLLAHPGLRADDLASLTLLVHAGAPCPPARKERVMELAPDDAVWEFYGSTEGQFTVCPPALWASSPGTVGVARAGSAIEVRDGAGRALPAGVTGTVHVRPPATARWSYWRDPAATAEAWDDGWFTVGDLGVLDAAGRLTLRGRPGDLIITGGVNVYPAEVERALTEIDGVGEVAVFGVPDTEWGQRVVAAIVPSDPARPPAVDAIRTAARTLLSPERTPRTVVLVEDLPRTPTGKVRRIDLPRLAPT